MSIGQDIWQEALNDIAQPSNDLNGVYLSPQGYLRYQNYLLAWQRGVDDSYQACLDRHRKIVRLDSGVGNSAVVINQHDFNTNVIVNNQASTTPRYGSYQGFNTCIRPEHTLAVLKIDRGEAGAGGIFRSGYEFKVSSVRSYSRGDYFEIDINFDHPVAEGIRIATTLHPDEILINQLHHNQGSGGFWSEVGSALNNISIISSDWFEIELPTLRYFE